MAVKEGKATSEWKAVLIGIATSLVTAVVSIVPGLLEQADKEGLLYTVGMVLVLICTYVIKRGWVKVTDRKAEALETSAGTSPNPT